MAGSLAPWLKEASRSRLRVLRVVSSLAIGFWVDHRHGKKLADRQKTLTMQRHDWSIDGAPATPVMQAKSSRHVLQVLSPVSRLFGVTVCGEVEKRDGVLSNSLCAHRKILGVEGIAEDIAAWCGGRI